MKKNIITIAITVLSLLSFSTSSYASNIKPDENIYKLTEKSILDYEPSNTPMMQNYKKDLYDKKVDLGRAMGLSAIYFGLGQMYSGETERGAWIMGGGTALLGGVFLFALPRFSNRQESVTSTANAISFVVLAGAYLWNIRDAYATAERVNKEIDQKLLLSDSLDKFSFSTGFENNGLSLGYNIKF
ncbi:MAG: hypothetical protein U0457_09535 [Candidatus Sericytochromatia bacterium]